MKVAIVGAYGDGVLFDIPDEDFSEDMSILEMQEAGTAISTIDYVINGDW